MNKFPRQLFIGVSEMSSKTHIEVLENIHIVENIVPDLKIFLKHEMKT